MDRSSFCLLDRILTALLLCCSCTSGVHCYAGTSPAAAVTTLDDKPADWTVYAGFESQHLFRGVKVGNELWEAGASLPVALSDTLIFTFAPWFGELGDGSYNELDLVAKLTWDTGYGEVSLAMAWYELAIDHWDTWEPMASYATKVGHIGSAELIWTSVAYLDLNADIPLGSSADYGDPGWLFETSLTTTAKVTDKLSLMPELRLGYGAGYYGVRGWNNAVAKLTANYALTPSLTISPFIGWSLALDGLLLTGQRNQLVVGTMLSFSF